MANNNADIELLAGLGVDSSEAEILKGIKIIQKRLKANHDARFKLNLEIDETVIRNTVDKLQNILKNKELSIDTKDSIQAITKEVNAMADIVTVARKASTEKLEFAKANKKVRESTDNTADAINRERNAMNSLDDIDNILNNINMSGRHGNSVFQQFGTTLRDAFYAFTAANLLEDAIYKVIDAGKEGVETVKELNDAATSLRMATGGSYESVQNLMNAYNEMGQELGALTTEISDSADAWLRQNHTVEDTNVLIKDSMMLSKISNLQAADSTKYLTSAMQGYKVAVNEVVGIVDKLSAVDLVSATDAGGLAEAMSRTAEGAQIAGISMDRLLGMIATTGEVTQKEMTSIGESYKTIFARMRDIKDNKLSIVGEDGEIEDLSNVEIVLDGLGIKLRKSNQEFRNFQDVLDDVASSWDSYSSVQQAAIAKSFSGVRQAENFLVMMENWDKVVKYTDVAANSSGTGEEKFGYYLESLEAKTHSLIASLENLASTTISEELYGSVLDVSKGIVDLTADTGVLKTALASLGTAGGTYVITQLAGFVRDSVQSFSNFSNALNMVRVGTINTADDMATLSALTQGLSNSQMRLLFSTGSLTDAQMVALMVANGTERELAEQQLQLWGLVGAQTVATGSTVTLGAAMKGLAASMLANPIILITTAVTLGVTAFNAYQSAVEKAEQKLDDLRTTLQKTESELSDIDSEMDNINKQIDELLAKDTPTLTDKNDLKRLQLENAELARRKVLLEAQKLEDTEALNAEIEKRYAKEYTEDEDIRFGDEIVNKEDYIGKLIGRYDELLGLQRTLTDEEKTEAEEIRKAMVEQGNSLVELTDGYVAVTEEQKRIKAGWEAMIAETARVAETYPGTVMDITQRLSDKFAHGTMWGDEVTFVSASGVDKQIASWINTLSNDEKKIMLQCDLDNASLADLKAYLAEQTADIEDSADLEIEYSFSYDKLGDIPQKLSEVESAYKTAQDALASYNEQGYYSMSVIDSILTLEDEYINILVDENGQLQINSTSMNKLASIKIETAKASIYQETCEELVRIKTLDTALASQELARINGTLTKSAYETAEALYEEVKAMGGANAALAGEVWEAASKKVKMLDNQLKNLNSGVYDVGTSAMADSVEKAKKEAEQATKDYIEAYMNFQKEQMNKSRINYDTYCNTVSNLLRKMFKEGKISAQDYHSYVKQMLESELDIFDKALSAIIRRLDTEIDKINDAIEAIQKQNEELEKQKTDYDNILSVIDSVYAKEIDKLNEQKDLLSEKISDLREEADAYDLIRKREEALYALEQAQNQRVKRVYAGSERGFIYTTDEKAIREAHDNLKDIENEEVISMLEKEQEALNESVELLEKYRNMWQEISDVYRIEQNKQLAIALYGENYEKTILANRLSDIEGFKENYISIQEQIDNNESMIASYEEKVEYFEKLKEEWSSITTAYEKSVEDQYVAMLLGQNWESDVLNGRLDVLGSFKESYISIQQAIADAAWASANAQIEAAKAAQAAANGSTGSAPVIGGGNNTSPTTSESYEVLDEYGKTMVRYYGENAASRAEEYKNSLDDAIHDLDKIKIQTYATGTKNAKRGLNLVGEEGTETYIDNDGNVSLVTKPTLIPMEGGETVKNASETKELLNEDNLVPLADILSGKVPLTLKRNDGVLLAKPQQTDFMNALMSNSAVIKPNINLPNYSQLSNVITKPQSIQQHNQFNVTLPNITDSSKAEKLFKELQQLPLDALQHSYKR